MTNTMMFRSLVSMVTEQALVPSQSGKKQFFTDYVYNGLCNEPKCLAGIDYLQRKKTEKLQFAKTGLFGQYQAPVFCLL